MDTDRLCGCCGKLKPALITKITSIYQPDQGTAVEWSVASKIDQGTIVCKQKIDLQIFTNFYYYFIILKILSPNVHYCCALISLCITLDIQLVYLKFAA